MGSQGDRPSHGRVVDANTAQKWVKYICMVYELRHHGVIEKMSKKLSYDTAKDCEVYGLEDIMLAITDQVDAKYQYLEQECNVYMTPSTPLTVDTITLPLRALAPKLADSQVLTLFIKIYEDEKAGRILAQAFSAAFFEYLPKLNPNVRLEPEEEQEDTSKIFLTSIKA